MNPALCAAAVLAYHEHSKHHSGRYAPGPGRLDWAAQPDPFRVYAGCPLLELPLVADQLAARYADVRAGRLPAPAPFDLAGIAALFELSLGLSAWKEFAGTRWALRCNPSSGNLHPTEGYLVTAALPGVAGGVWHYVSREHCLEQRAVADAQWGRLWGAAGVLLVLTSIHWREAWKYGVRAYRYCQHDCGHAIGAVAYAAAALGWQARLLAEAGDDDIAALCGIDRAPDFDGAEREAPDALLWVGPPQAAPPDSGALRTACPALRWNGHANRLSASHTQWPAIEEVAVAARKPHGAQPASPSAPLPALAPLAGEVGVSRLIRQRRSAVDFDGLTALPAPAFFTLLDALLPRAVPPWSAWPLPPRVHLCLFVHRVDGVEPGLYCLARDAAALPALRTAMRSEWSWEKRGPPSLPLYLLMAADVRESAQLIACHQAIAADSCFALGMLADFAHIGDAPWRYRQLFWECGLIGQALYLEAQAAGVRGTGIGCFFDDAMHRLLGLRDTAWQSLYHFTVGGAVEDARLATRPPYAHLLRRRGEP